MASTDVPGMAATPGASGYPKGSPADRVKTQTININKELQALYQECHELTGPGSPECNAVLAIQDAVSELASHIGKGAHEQPMEEEVPMPEEAPPPDMMADAPMGGGPYAEAARGFRSDMINA